MYTQGYRPTGKPEPIRRSYADAPRKTGGGSGRQAPKKRKRKKSFRWQLFKVLLVLIALAAAGGGIYIWKTQVDVKPYTSVFLDNVYVDGIDLTGMTWDEGKAAVQKQIDDKINSWYIRLENSAGEYKDITAETLGISRDPDQALEEAWAIGHETSLTDRKDIFELKSEIDTAKLSESEFPLIRTTLPTPSPSRARWSAKRWTWRRCARRSFPWWRPSPPARCWWSRTTWSRP
jgi:hypothetical protein